MMVLLLTVVFGFTLWIGRNPRRAGRLTSRIMGQAKRRPQPPVDHEVMSIGRAASVLGVSTSATQAQAKAAYLRLIRLTHPDLGGTAGLAAELNAARDAFARRA